MTTSHTEVTRADIMRELKAYHADTMALLEGMGDLRKTIATLAQRVTALEERNAAADERFSEATR